MPALLVESKSAGLLDFAYDREPTPSGVLDARASAEIVRLILGVEPRVRASFLSTAQKADCRYACAAWMRALREQGIDTREVGGNGVDEPDFTSDWRLVPLEARSGYRDRDGTIHRHYWLHLGPDLVLFDPTAHQFDNLGGISLERYTVDGRPYLASLTD